MTTSTGAHTARIAGVDTNEQNETDKERQYILHRILFVKIQRTYDKHAAQMPSYTRPYFSATLVTVAHRIPSWTLIGCARAFWRFSGLHRAGTVEASRMTRRCRFDVWNAMFGLQSLLHVHRVVHTRWWHTGKVMATPPAGGNMPIEHGRL